MSSPSTLVTVAETHLQPSEKTKPLRRLDKVSVQTAQKELAENKSLIVGEGLKDWERCVSSSKGRFYDTERLKSNLVEADAKLLFHAK